MIPQGEAYPLSDTVEAAGLLEYLHPYPEEPPIHSPQPIGDCFLAHQPHFVEVDCRE